MMVYDAVGVEIGPADYWPFRGEGKASVTINWYFGGLGVFNSHAQGMHSIRNDTI